MNPITTFFLPSALACVVIVGAIAYYTEATAPQRAQARAEIAASHDAVDMSYAAFVVDGRELSGRRVMMTGDLYYALSERRGAFVDGESGISDRTRISFEATDRDALLRLPEACQGIVIGAAEFHDFCTGATIIGTVDAREWPATINVEAIYF